MLGKDGRVRQTDVSTSGDSSRILCVAELVLPDDGDSKEDEMLPESNVTQNGGSKEGD